MSTFFQASVLLRYNVKIYSELETEEGLYKKMLIKFRITQK